MWLDKATNILGKTGDNKALKQLVHIIDKTQLSPVYQPDKSIKYCNIKELFWGLNPRSITKTRNYKTGKEELLRTDLEDWYRFSTESCYLQEGPTSPAKDHYLIQTRGSFITLRVLDNDTIYSSIQEDDYIDEIQKDGTTIKVLKPNKWTKDYVDKLLAKRNKIIDFIKKSTLFKSYDGVVVPEEFSKKFETSEEVAKEKENEEKLTPAELRKLAEQTIVHSLVKSFDLVKDKYPFKWVKQTVKISDLKDDAGNVYYSYGDEETIPLATILLWRSHKFAKTGVSATELNPDLIKLYKVSKSMPKKFLKKHKHINQFFKVETDKSKTMSRELIEWGTARYIHENLDNLKFMRNYRLFNPDIADLYKEVKDYSIQYYANDFRSFTDKYSSGKSFIDGVLDYTSKVTELQLFIRDHKEDALAIQVESQRLFGIDTVTEALGYNLDMYDKMQNLLNYAESIKALFNHINLLTDISNPDIPIDTETMIKEVIETKGLSRYVIPKTQSVIVSNEQKEAEVLEVETKEEL